MEITYKEIILGKSNNLDAGIGTLDLEELKANQQGSRPWKQTSKETDHESKPAGKQTRKVNRE